MARDASDSWQDEQEEKRTCALTDLHVHKSMLVALHEINSRSELCLHRPELLVHGSECSRL